MVSPGSVSYLSPVDPGLRCCSGSGSGQSRSGAAPRREAPASPSPPSPQVAGAIPRRQTPRVLITPVRSPTITSRPGERIARPPEAPARPSRSLEARSAKSVRLRRRLVRQWWQSRRCVVRSGGPMSSRASTPPLCAPTGRRSTSVWLCPACAGAVYDRSGNLIAASSPPRRRRRGRLSRDRPEAVSTGCLDIGLSVRRCGQAQPAQRIRAPRISGEWHGRAEIATSTLPYLSLLLTSHGPIRTVNLFSHPRIVGFEQGPLRARVPQNSLLAGFPAQRSCRPVQRQASRTPTDVVAARQGTASCSVWTSRSSSRSRRIFPGRSKPLTAPCVAIVEDRRRRDPRHGHLVTGRMARGSLDSEPGGHLGLPTGSS